MSERSESKDLSSNPYLLSHWKDTTYNYSLTNLTNML